MKPDLAVAAADNSMRIEAQSNCFVCKKPLAEQQWFCRLTQNVEEAADPQAAKILLCSPTCALRHFAAKTEPTMSTESKAISS